MPKLRISSALSALQSKLGGQTTTTSQQRHKTRSSRSLISSLGKRRSSRVEPFTPSQDLERCSGKIADHFARVASPDNSCQKIPSRGQTSRKSPDCNGAICHRFTLPGAVDDDSDSASPPVSSSSSKPVSPKNIAETKRDQYSDTRVESYHDNAVDVLVIHHPDNETAIQSDETDDDEYVDDADCDERRTVVPYEKEDNLNDEIGFFDRVKEEGDDYLNLDELLERCPRTETIRNLESAFQVSKCVTTQLEKAVKKWSRISRGPFPRPQGSSQTKAEVIDGKCSGLIRESARYLEEMNKVFFGLFPVTERLDNVESSQKHHVKAIKKQRKRKQVKLPRKRQFLAALYLLHSQERRCKEHTFEALLGKRIPPTIVEEEEC